MKSCLKIFSVIVFAALALGCGNTKDGFVSRTFHNLSAHYNGYYNAGLKLQDGSEKLAESQKDVYDRILPVFKYGDVAKSKAVYPQMDDVIKRTGIVIQRHTIVDRNGNEKPNSEKWIDDNWMRYGQAQFYKHEYFEAIETFKYVETTYKKETSRFAASLWIAKTYLQLTQLKEAEDKLDYLRNQKDMPKEVMGDFEAASADYYLQTRNFEQAIVHLTKASQLAKKRTDKIRFMFILAQLNQQHGDFKKAFQLYTDVIKKNPPYEMDFNARINRARCYDAESKNSHRVKEELMKMVKDPKNKEYLDQVYYALAGLSQKENNEPEAIAHLHKSVEVSTSNQNQKALSYLELGKIYFAKPDYKLAQAYYDSCTTNLSNDHPDYTDILTRRNSLTRLIKYLKTIATEDSLQTLSKMSDAQRDAVVENKFKAEEEEKRKKAEEDKEQDVKQLFQQTDVKKEQELQKGTGSSWYFYNSQAVSFGMTEFTKKWSNRKLEDNWRRSNKQQVVQEEEVVQDSLVLDEKEIVDPKLALAERKKKMLENIPTSQEALDKSATKAMDAYYNAAMIYNEQLGDKKASAEMFETLLQKYPECKYKLQGYYQLYRIYLALGNTAKSEYYKDILLSKYPDSDYAMIIKNPNYMAEKEAKKSDLEIFYEETYRKYLSGQYVDVIKRKSQAEMNFPNNLLLPKFDYLKTLSIGRTQSVASFTASLQDIVRIYSTDPVKDDAQDILDFLNGNKVDENKLPEKDTVAKLYSYAPDTTQMVIISFQNIGGPIKADNLKVKLSNYNSKYYGLKGYKITSQLFDHRLAIIIIKDFNNRDEAVAYNNGLLDNDEVYGNLNPDAYQEFIVSANNFGNFVKQKKIDEYLDFYQKFYK